MAITRSNLNTNTSGTTVTAANAINIGDLIIVTGNWAVGFSNPGITDNINSGPYTLWSATPVSNGYGNFNVYYKIANANAGPATLIASQGGTNAQRISLASYTGFSGLPTIIPADISFAQATGTALNSGSVNASQNAEVFYAWYNSLANTVPVTHTPFTVLGGGSGQFNFLDTMAFFPAGIASGTPTSYTCTLGASDSWDTQILGFYDGPVDLGGKISPFGLGPSPLVPYNNSQFRWNAPFRHDVSYNPVPLFLSGDLGSFVFTGENATLSAISQATLLANPGIFTLNGLPVTFLLGPAAGVLFGTTGRPGGRITLNSKRPGEFIGYSVDFQNSLAAGEVITSASVTSTVYTGVDPSPQGIVSGSSTWQGSIVDQGILGGVVGTIYSTIWRITTSFGQIIEINALIAILADSP